MFRIKSFDFFNFIDRPIGRIAMFAVGVLLVCVCSHLTRNDPWVQNMWWLRGKAADYSLVVLDPIGALRCSLEGIGLAIGIITIVSTFTVWIPKKKVE